MYSIVFFTQNMAYFCFGGIGYNIILCKYLLPLTAANYFILWPWYTILYHVCVCRGGNVGGGRAERQSGDGTTVVSAVTISTDHRYRLNGSVALLGAWSRDASFKRRNSRYNRVVKYLCKSIWIFSIWVFEYSNTFLSTYWYFIQIFFCFFVFKYYSNTFLCYWIGTNLF